MADNDIIINIETAYKSGDMEAFKRSLEDAKNKVDGLSNANRALKESTAASAKEFNNAQRAAQALNSVSSLSRGSLLSLAQVFESLGGKFALVTARVILPVQAAIAGWKAGIPIAEKLWSAFVIGASNAIGPISAISASMKGLNDADLTKIRNEISALSADTENIAANIDRAAARREKSRAPKTAAQIAEIESNITDPSAREKALAIIKQGEAEDIASDQAKDALAKLLPAEREVRGIDDQLAKLKKERDEAASSMREASALSPTNPAFRARRERFARGETVVAKEIETLSSKRESAYQTYLDRQTDFQSAAQNVDATKASGVAQLAKLDRDKQKADQDAMLAAKSNFASAKLELASTPAQKAALIRELAQIEGQKIDADTSTPKDAAQLRKSALGLQTSKDLAGIGSAKFQQFRSLESEAEKEQREADAARGRIGFIQTALSSARSGSPEARKLESSLSTAKVDYSKEVAEANAARAAAAAALKEVSAALRDIGADISILRDQFKNRDN